jgi:hypothetical protein
MDDRPPWGGVKGPRCYQEITINRVVQAVLQGKVSGAYHNGSDHSPRHRAFSFSDCPECC